jgi:biopolymer transport protein ExbD
MSVNIEFERRPRRIRPINVISLIDVMFVLILFFLMTGHIEKFSPVTVDLPVADNGQILEQGPIEIVLGKYDEILLNDEYVQTDQFAEAIRQELQFNPERIVTIKADAFLEANRLVQVLEKIGDAGGKNISVVTKTGEAAR